MVDWGGLDDDDSDVVVVDDVDVDVDDDDGDVGCSAYDGAGVIQQRRCCL